MARPEERHFLGFRRVVDPLDGNVEVLLSKRSKERIDAKIRELRPRAFGGNVDRCIQALNAYLLGWIGFFGACTGAVLRILRALDAHIRRRLRAMILKDWKTKRTTALRLIGLGVKPKTAWNGVYKGRRSSWNLSHAPPVERGLRDAYFAKRGLESLAERWMQHPAGLIVAPAQQIMLALG